MKHINELEKKLSNLFNWHKSRIGCLAQIKFCRVRRKFALQ